MNKVELGIENHLLYLHQYPVGSGMPESQWRTCMPRPPWGGTISSYIAVPARYAAAVQAATKIRADDLEFVLSQVGESFAQPTEEAEEAVRRLEDLKDALNRSEHE